MIFSTKLVEKMRAGKPAVGFWINLSDPALVQLAGIAGFDWVMIDTEHNPLSDAQVQGHIYALGSFDTSCIVRVRANRQENIKWVLDSGAAGIIIPAITDYADAMEAVRNSKYQPLGMRGYGPNRASNFMTELKKYNEISNRDIILICQVELASAVKDIDKICDIPGIDGIWIGPTDLAQSMGHLGNHSHPEVQAAIKHVIDAANRHKMPWGIPTAKVEDFQKYASMGGTILTLGSDTSVLRTHLLGVIEELKIPNLGIG
jgi:2-keto-3-deoxy-L-rhamnonate aldolase RhmA